MEFQGAGLCSPHIEIGLNLVTTGSFYNDCVFLKLQKALSGSTLSLLLLLIFIFLMWKFKMKTTKFEKNIPGQYFGHLMRRADSLEMTLMLGNIEGRRRGWDSWMASPTQWIWVWANWEIVKGREAWRAAVHGVTKSWTWLRD